MIKKRLESSLSFLILVSFFCVGTSTTRASDCYIPTVCQAFSRAELVFTGELLSVESAKKPGTLFNLVAFRVDEVFKGTAAHIENVQLPGSLDTELKIGESYFVYKDVNRSLPPVCNRTSLLRNAVSELKYAKALLAANPTFQISGLLSSGSKDKLKNSKVFVSTPSGVQGLTIDQNGFYSFTATKTGDYKVIIELPFTASILTNNFGTMFTSTVRTVNYSVSFKPNECDFRHVQFTRQD